eukprot:1161694-Pelagomonas_calceolata.AAC.13
MLLGMKGTRYPLGMNMLLGMKGMRYPLGMKGTRYPLGMNMLLGMKGTNYPLGMNMLLGMKGTRYPLGMNNQPITLANHHNEQACRRVHMRADHPDWRRTNLPLSILAPHNLLDVITLHAGVQTIRTGYEQTMSAVAKIVRSISNGADTLTKEVRGQECGSSAGAHRRYTSGVLQPAMHKHAGHRGGMHGAGKKVALSSALLLDCRAAWLQLLGQTVAQGHDTKPKDMLLGHDTSVERLKSGALSMAATPRTNRCPRT